MWSSKSNFGHFHYLLWEDHRCLGTGVITPWECHTCDIRMIFPLFRLSPDYLNMESPVSGAVKLQKYMRCQVPNSSFPSRIGTVQEEPMRSLYMSVGISFIVTVIPIHGNALFSAYIISRTTSGSAAR